jgi:very-short-patch-repair endonuclease
VFLGKSKSGENYRILTPVFVVPVIAAVREGLLELQPTMLLEINHQWVERRIPDARRRREFLDEIGLSPTQFGDADQEEVWPVGGIKDAVKALFQARPTWWKEFADPDRLSSAPKLSALHESGLYNRAVLMRQPPLKFTKRLVDELQQLAYGVNDEDLDRTALSTLFPHTPAGNAEASPTSDATTVRLAEFQLLNSDQRQACERALSERLTVITGPPGTGKSMVVAHTLVNSAIRGQTALFASRNHQALEAVEPRINAMVEPEALLLRPTRPFGAQAAQFEWHQAMTTLLARPRRETLENEREMARSCVHEVLTCRHEAEAMSDRIIELEALLAEAESNCRVAISESPTEWQDIAAEQPKLPEKATVEPLIRLAKQCAVPLTPLYLAPFLWVQRLVCIRRLRSRARDVFAGLPREVADAVVGACDPAQSPPSALAAACERLNSLRELVDALGKRASLEAELAGFPDRGALRSKLRDLQRQLEESTQMLMRLLAESAGANISGEQREEFAQLRAGLRNRPQEILDGSANSELAKAFRGAMPELMRHFPLWCVSNLSVSRAIPLAPASFDLVIVDEASQCDIASVVPLLYRARRAVIVGDPNQLPHVTQMSRDTEMRLRDQAGVASFDFERFTLAANSMYDLASSSKGSTQIALRNHYRCHPQIAEFCNDTFYNGILHVMTNADALTDRLGLSRKARACVWEHVPGDAVGASTGCYSPGQTNRILQELERLAEARFPGTIGVVTPFRAQVQRINDIVHQKIGTEVLTRWRFLVDTVDGFQGDERDLILFALVGSADMPSGSAHFLRATPNRFNVAVSRARALLRVYGDEHWASTCGIPFISDLLRRCREVHETSRGVRREDLIGPVWEPRFANALREAGLVFEQQYPSCGYFLDFALFGACEKLNIEVDGEMFHRSAGGGRRVDDIYRDLVLESAGWRVLRFWVYQIRENIDECVARVRAEYDQYCQPNAADRAAGAGTA